MQYDVWVFKDGLAIRVVALALWKDSAEAQAKALNATLSEQQKADGYEYRAIGRGR